MKIYKQAGMWDDIKRMFKKSPPPPPPPTGRPPPVRRSTERLVEKDPEKEIVPHFKDETKWGDEIINAIQKDRTNEDLDPTDSPTEATRKTNENVRKDALRAKIINDIKSIITKCLVESWQYTGMVFVPFANTPESIINKVSDTFNTYIPDFVKSVSLPSGDIKSGPQYNAMAAKYIVKIRDQISQEIMNDDEFKNSIYGKFLAEQKNIDDEDKYRKEQLRDWQSSNREQLRQQQEAWAEQSGIKATGTLHIGRARASLVERKDKVTKVLDDAIAAYDRGKRMIDRDPSIDPKTAYHDLSVILESRFRTKLVFR